jgi:translation initiation factor IF-2
MRIYEFAKKLNISTKQLQDMLADNGFGVKSHMAVLDNKTMEAVNQIFTSGQIPTGAPVVTLSPAPNNENTINSSNIKEAPVKQEIKNNVSLKQHAANYPAPVQQVVANATTPRSMVARPMTVSEVAQAVSVQVAEVILVLLRWGIMAAKNQVLTEDLVARVARHYQIEVTKPVAPSADIIDEKSIITSQGKDLRERSPVVVVLGHVDHGKTTLLDFIRKTRVASREKGGITQHLGAYEAQTPKGNVVFLDTPGHEAFSKIRQRGIKVADIVILIVAADDGVMPQTIESIKRAKSMNVPIVVAINKVDKVEQRRVDVVKRELSQHGLVVEEWGGDVVCVPISAKTGQGIDSLLEMVLLQAQMMELRADVSGGAKGYILESKLEKGRGAVATIISQHGKLKVGDYIVSGSTGGRVSSIVDSHGARIMEAMPTTPVLVAGFETLPEAGDYFEVVAKENYRRMLETAREQKLIILSKAHAEGALNIVVKTDTDSSREALVESIVKLSQKAESGFNILHIGIGNISESDVELAYNTGASIIGMHVKIETNAAILAQRKKVAVSLFDIIYKLLEELEKRDEKTKRIELVRVKIGEAEVIRVFDIKNIGIIAGAQVKEGRIVRDGILVVYRGGRKIGEGKLRSLQREKRSVKEVHGGYECGFMLENYDDWAVGDRVESYIEEPKK